MVQMRPLGEMEGYNSTHPDPGMHRELVSRLPGRELSQASRGMLTRLYQSIYRKGTRQETARQQGSTSSLSEGIACVGFRYASGARQREQSSE
jgi:hypothetical protein